MEFYHSRHHSNKTAKSNWFKNNKWILWITNYPTEKFMQWKHMNIQIYAMKTYEYSNLCDEDLWIFKTSPHKWIDTNSAVPHCEILEPTSDIVMIFGVSSEMLFWAQKLEEIYAENSWYCYSIVENEKRRQQVMGARCFFFTHSIQSDEGIIMMNNKRASRLRRTSRGHKALCNPEICFFF